MTAMPAQYYNRHDPAKNFENHLFIAGRGLQSAELNEIQSHAAYRLRGVADALFKDGDVIRDASVSVNEITGVTQCASGAVYLRGAVRGVPSATITIPVVGEVAIGIRLIETVVTADDDPSLLDPATGTRNYAEPGAERLEVVTAWAFDTDGGTGDFFPIYTVTMGVLNAKEPPPSLDAISQALSRYDRDSSGGSYVVSGLAVRAMPDVGSDQVYSLGEGRCRVYGYGMEFPTSRRVIHSAVPDLLAIANEPHLSATEAAQRINFDRSPGTAPSEVSITAEKTVTVTHGVTTGAQDPLPDTSVLSLIEVKQGGTTYTATTDYLLTAGKVDWTPAGAEPAPGSTYTVKYRYITDVTPTAVDDTGFTVEGAVTGTLILVTYSQKLPRIDRLCVNTDGAVVWLIGVASAYWPQPPVVPDDMLALASVYQTWDASRKVTNDGVRVVPMPVLAGIEDRIDYVLQEVARTRLESNIHTREGGTKKGLFVDPFLDDSQRDAGTVQTAAIVNGELLLPITSTVHQMGADITAPVSLNFSHTSALDQTLRTGSMKINPYMGFDLVPAPVTLTPAVDRWTDVDVSWSSPQTMRMVIGAGDRVSISSSSRAVLLGSATSKIETLRPITVSYRIEGFGAGEALSSILFDGVSRPTGGAVANGSGVVTGSFSIPTGIPAGTKDVVFTGAGGRVGLASFSGQGTLERQTWQQQTTVTETLWQSPPPPISVAPVRVDPLAQTFALNAAAQVSGVDLWFVDRPTTTTRVQIRTTSNGVPTGTVLAEATRSGASLNIGGASTRIAFDRPVTLLGGVEYAIVILCNDAVGSVSVAELGKYDATAARWITSQPYTVGVLLSSSNASTWTPHQDRDLTFRILSASFSETQHNVALGNVTVAGATDLLMMSYAERPGSATQVEYSLTLPDASVIKMSDGQSVQLAAAVTGNIAVSAKLIGTAQQSPVLFPGSQLVSGVVGASGTYVSRAIPGGTGVTVKVIYEAVIPSGATLAVEYKGPDGGDVWAAVPQTATRAVDDGFTEFTHVIAPITEATVQIRLTLNGTTAARPRARSLRAFVM